MSLTTLLINGPARCGKSTVARLIRDHVVSRPIHLLRLKPAADEHSNVIQRITPSADDPSGQPWASVHQADYTAERVFETMPEALQTVARIEPNPFTIVEADDDPNVRHAYPYDFRVFVMTNPNNIYDVFREPKAARNALQQVMEDTAAFASEIFGLFDDNTLDDSVGVRHTRTTRTDQPGKRPQHIEQLDIGASQVRHFVSSPIGAEIASRIQLQPGFHALVESDVVLISTARAGRKTARDECVDRIEKLLSRIRHDARRRSVLYWGNLTKTTDPTRRKLIRRLKVLLKQ